MKKIFKRILMLGSLAAVGYQGFRAYRLYKIMRVAENELPAYLGETYGETPKVGINLTINAVIVAQLKLTFSPETFAKHPDLEEAVTLYIKETYPQLNKCRLKVMVIDSTMSVTDILKKYNPKVYAKFGKLIEKKLQEKEAKHIHEEPTD
jgi:hypothetical protein